MGIDEFTPTDSEPTAARPAKDIVKIVAVQVEPGICREIRRYLDQRDLTNLIATRQPTVAKTLIQRHQPDLILLDLTKLQTDGLEILRWVRAETNLCHTPVLILTKSQNRSTKRRALELGATDFLETPVDTTDLVARVRNTLALKRHHDRLAEHAENLEAQVAAQTIELCRANQRLEQANERLQHEIDDRRSTAQRLEHEASHDTLTDLPNRTVLLNRLERCADHAVRRPGYMYAVLFFDLDNFKLINDSLGHDVGDKLLVEVADRLTRCLRVVDSIARPQEVAIRLGGDEFVVLLEDINRPSNTVVVAQRIQKEISQPFHICDRQIQISASIGIAIGSRECNTAKDLLRNADTAMYRAKSMGKAQHALFDETMHENVIARLQVESDIRQVVEKQQLVLRYQPIVSLKTGAIEGFESLVRWNHPDRGLLSADQIIPIAEETGTIIAIGHWVLENTCRQLKLWDTNRSDAKSPWISINISQRQMSDPDFVSDTRRVIDQTGVDPHRLKFEITESAIMNDPEAVIDTLRRIKETGIEVIMDDFGTGLSSLSCLHRFPIDVLKIDPSFVTTMADKRDYTAIVQAITTLAHNLGASVVAEGVEKRDQLAQLVNLDCDFGQGYYFSPPLDNQATEAFMKSSNHRWLRSA